MDQMQVTSIEMLKRCLKPSQAARLLGVSVRRVHQFCNESRFDAVQIGGAWYIEPQSLQEFAAKDRQAGNPNFGKSA